jgi:hypothetical protein
MNNFAFQFTNRVAMLRKHRATAIPPKSSRVYFAKPLSPELLPIYIFPPWTGWELYSTSNSISEQQFPPWTGWELK